MNQSQGAFSLKRPSNVIEWKLLAFLILFMDVKLVVKVFALVAIYLLQPDFRFGFHLRNSRIPLFYLIVILITAINFIIIQNFSVNYIIVALTGIFFWLACILAIHQLKLFVDRNEPVRLHNTLRAFFILNIVFSFFNLFLIVLDIGFRNPFLYQGEYQKYFINTGDYIRGITFDTSTTNALINCFGTVYFLYRKKYSLVLACMVTLLITASNLSNVIIITAFTGIFLFSASKVQKSIIAVSLSLLVIFLARLSPQNDTYQFETLKNFVISKEGKFVTPPKVIPIRERPDSLLTPESRKEKIAVLYLDSLERERLKRFTNADLYPLYGFTVALKPELPKDSIHSASYQWKRDTTAFQRLLVSYVYDPPDHPSVKYEPGIPGKILAFIQSFHYLTEHPQKIIIGAGAGNFSSKLAFKATGLAITGRFPDSFSYCNPDFLNNHLNLYTYFFTRNAESHSVIHTPASVYDQLMTEYGLIGISAFAVFYIGFFLRRPKNLTYGVPLIMLMLAAFMVDYWFEQLSLVVLFEFMMLINMKEQNKTIPNE